MKFRFFTIPTLIASLSLMTAGCHHAPWDLIRDVHAQIDSDYLYEISMPEEDFILTLDEAIRIAMENNLDLMVKEKEFAVQQEIAYREKFKMLPSLTANGEAKMRNKNTGSFSQSLTAQPPAPPSISLERFDRLADVTLAWNFLDFGVSFYRAQQEKNRALILDLDYERAGQNIILEIVKQYWKTAVAKHALKNSKEILKKSRDIQTIIQEGMDHDFISNIEGLQQQIKLIASRIQLQAYAKDYHEAKLQLGLFVGIPPGIDFDVEDIQGMPTEVLTVPVQELEDLALHHRPELFSKDVEERVMIDEVRVALLQLLPSNALYAAFNYESNKFLIFHEWLSAGAKISWQLLNTPYRAQDIKVAKSRRDWIYHQRLALSLGVLTQVHIAYLLYHDALQDFLLYQELYLTKKRLVETSRKYMETGELSEADVIALEAEMLVSEMDTLKVYGSLQTMLEQLNNSIGIPRWLTVEAPSPEENCNDKWNYLFTNEEIIDSVGDDSSDISKIPSTGCQNEKFKNLRQHSLGAGLMD